MIVGKPPLFLAEGTFQWTKLGYMYSQPPSIDLMMADLLVSPDPWIVLAATFEHAKQGDFAPIRNLRKCIHEDHPFLLNRACLCLIGDAGADEALMILLDLMEQGSPSIILDACQAASQASRLWLIPSMLKAWHRARTLGDHETIGFAIADVLESYDGEMASLAGKYHSTHSPSVSDRFEAEKLNGVQQSFGEIVEQKIEEFHQRLSDKKLPLWNGQVFGVRSLAIKMLELIQFTKGKPELSGLFIPFRHRFEASTGIECSRFFKNNAFQPLSATDILEAFLDNPDSQKYEEGVRYFFGHRIPH